MTAAFWVNPPHQSTVNSLALCAGWSYESSPPATSRQQRHSNCRYFRTSPFLALATMFPVSEENPHLWSSIASRLHVVGHRALLEQSIEYFQQNISRALHNHHNRCSRLAISSCPFRRQHKVKPTLFDDPLKKLPTGQPRCIRICWLDWHRYYDVRWPPLHK